ncbi:TonB-dependent receptor [Neisseriaceae bacterium B1]
MLFYKRLFIISTITFTSSVAWSNDLKADGVTDDVSSLNELAPVYIQGKRIQTEGSLLDGGRKSRSVSEKIIRDEELKKRGANIGDALSQELGIHASQFGGGASAPIIRGQEGKRIKILHNNGETLDMSAMSPDHAVTVDSVLAKQVEVLRGANTLLYSSGNSAGVVNVVDNKIPTRQPEKENKREVELGTRFNLADKERLFTGSITQGIGQNFAVHAEGLYRKSDDYKTPNYTLKNQTSNKLANSFADSYSGSVGASWVGDKGYLGLAYSQRKDRYGLPAHSHLYDNAYIDIIRLSVVNFEKPYLRHYPFLLDELDVDYDNPGITFLHNHNGGHIHTARDEDHRDSHQPLIGMKSKRWDLRGEWKQPVTGIDKIRLQATHVTYRHDEQTGSQVDSEFRNKGRNIRLEFVHSPLLDGRLQGAIGFQHLYQDNRASNKHALHFKKQHLLQDNFVTQNSFFAVEQLSGKNWQWQLGARVERQKIAMKFNNYIRWDDEDVQPKDAHLKKPHKGTARSYVSAFNWLPNQQNKFSLVLSRQERMPNNQELYAHGKHLATNSFDAGNKNLKKEQSNNVELAWSFAGDKWDWKISTYYNHFKNYIYSDTLNDGRGPRSLSSKYPLRVNRYNQSKARFYGLEAELNYQIHPDYRVGVFGDMVRGKLKDRPALPTGFYLFGKNRGKPIGYAEQPDIDAPRVPPARLGMRVNADFTANLKGDLEFYRVFKQKRVSKLEQPTAGYNMLNAGLEYSGKWGTADYSTFVRVTNLLNAKAYNHASHLPYLPQMGRSISIGANVKF